MAKQYLATQVCVVSYPELLDPGKGRNTINLKHNAAVKESLKKCLLHHRRYNVPKHFQFGAHAKYKYKKRSERTLQIKSKLGRRYLDLVLTGKAKQRFTKGPYRIRVGGKTYSGVGAINATMTISWPGDYKEKANARPGAIRKRDMSDEIERWTETEKKEMAQLCMKFYVEEMKKALARSPRMRKKYSSKLAAQGIV